MKRHFNFTRLKMDPLSTWSKVRQPPLQEGSLNLSLCHKPPKRVLLDPLQQMLNSHNSNNSQHLVECQVWVVLVASEEWGDSRTCKLGEVLLECKEWAQWTPIRYNKWWDPRWSSSCLVTLLSWRWWSNRIPNCVLWLKRIPKFEWCCLILSYFKAWWLLRTWTRPQEWCKEGAEWGAWAQWAAWICLCQEEAQTLLALHNQINQMLIRTQRWWEEWVEVMAVLEVMTQLWCKLWWVEAVSVLQYLTDLPVNYMLPNWRRWKRWALAMKRQSYRSSCSAMVMSILQ